MALVARRICVVGAPDEKTVSRNGRGGMNSLAIAVVNRFSASGASADPSMGNARMFSDTTTVSTRAAATTESHRDESRETGCCPLATEKAAPNVRHAANRTR